jgi:thymidylate kinase
VNGQNETLELFRTLVEESRQADIPLVQLRYRPLSAEYAFHGDYDFIMPQESRKAFLTLLFDLASRNGIAFGIDQTKSGKLKVLLHDTDSDGYITLEIWNHLQVHDPENASLRRIFWEDLAPELEPSGTGRWTLPFDVEALYYLSHLHTKTKRLEAEEVGRRVAYYLHEAKARNEVRIAELFRGLEARGIRAVAHEANLALIEKGLLRRSDDKQRFWQEKRDRICEQWHRVGMKQFANKRLVPFIGPDGVGKTTLIKSACADAEKASYYRFKKMFRKSLLYKSLFPLMRSMTKKGMGVKPAKNQVDDYCGGMVLGIALSRYPLLWLQTKLKGHLLADRYYFDFLLKNSRFEGHGSELREGWRRWLRLLPTPGLLVQLDAPSAVIHARKEELSAEDIDRYRALMFRLYLEKPSARYLYLNTSRPLEECTKTLMQALTGVGVKVKKKEIIDLEGAQLEGSGNERLCYVNPLDPSKVIKVKRRGVKRRNQNRIEAVYYRNLNWRGVSFDHIPQCYGWVETSEGRGLMFERVANVDGTSPISFDEAVHSHALTEEEARKLLKELGEYLLENTILFADVALCNLICQKREGGWRLIIIDGLGSRHCGPKFWFYRNVHFFSRMRIRRQLVRLMENFELLLQKMEAV